MTVMLTICRADRAGVPLSVTVTVTLKVPAVAGVQVKAPVVGLIVADGAPATEYVSVWAGVSASVAWAVKLRG